MGCDMADESNHDAPPASDDPQSVGAASDVAAAEPAISSPRPRQRLGGPWLAAALATLVTLAVVFGVLDVTHALFPQKAPDSTRPIVINARVIGAPTATSGPVSPLHVSPQQLTLACHSSAVLTLTSASSQPMSWSVDTVGAGLLLGTNQPQAGTLAPGQSAHLSLVALGSATDTSLTMADDQSGLITVQVSVHCP